MTDRERAMAVLHGDAYDRLPIVHFGFWRETLQKWAAEGHLSLEEATTWADGNPTDSVISAKLGFDFDWYACFSPDCGPRPTFESRIVKELPDGSKHVLNGEGVVLLQKPDAGSIPAEISHTLTDRASWEEHYRWRYEWSEERVTSRQVRTGDTLTRWDKGGLDFLRDDRRDYPYGLFLGSLFGHIRNVLGVVNCSYLQLDDEPLFDDIIDTVADLCYRNAEYVLAQGVRFDFAHFWEDICFKNGPLVSPRVFDEKVGPHYARLTQLCRDHGIDIVSLDCDGCIDALIPTWLQNGVNTMFPIEVGTWNASIAPWRETYGQELRGVGGMNKVVFARDEAAIDAEIERLKPLIALGRYIPCPDHRIPPDAKWELVRYYTQRLRELG